MRIYNRYVLYLTIVTGVANILLAFGGQEGLDVYFIVDTIVFLGITLLHVRLIPRAMMALSIIGCILLSGIMAILVVKTIHNLTGG